MPLYFNRLLRDIVYSYKWKREGNPFVSLEQTAHVQTVLLFTLMGKSQLPQLLFASLVQIAHDQTVHLCTQMEKSQL